MTLRTAIAAGLIATAAGATAESPAPARIVDPAASVEAKLQRLLDREEIAQVIVDYGHAFDRQDWALHRSVFTDEIEMDFSASIGDGLVTMQADDWVAAVQPFFAALDATQHVTMPLAIEIDGDAAYARTMLHAQHHDADAIGGAVQTMIGTYDVWFTRTPDGWRIRKMVQHIDWNEGNWRVFLKAAGLAD